jgi:hypothetical protein
MSEVAGHSDEAVVRGGIGDEAAVVCSGCLLQADKHLLTIAVDVIVGGRFARPAAWRASCARHADEAAAASQLPPARVLLGRSVAEQELRETRSEAWHSRCNK